MVLGAYEKYVFGPRREAQKRAEEAEKRAEETKKRLYEFDTAVKAWNERRLDAEAQGKPFNEPFPGENKQFQERRNPMVLGAYEEHVAGPRRKAQKERDEAVKRADEAQRKLEEAMAWNRRRLKAQADGEPFGEPYPITDAEPES